MGQEVGSRAGSGQVGVSLLCRPISPVLFASGIGTTPRAQSTGADTELLLEGVSSKLCFLPTRDGQEWPVGPLQSAMSCFFLHGRLLAH